MSQLGIRISDKSRNGDSVIFWAAKGRQNRTLQILRHDATVDKPLKYVFNCTILHMTVPWARPDPIRWRVRLNIVELDAQDHVRTTCLHRAAQKDARESLEFILSEYRVRHLSVDPVDAKN